MKKNILLFILLVTMLSVNAQSYEVGTSSALWSKPTAADFAEAKKVGIGYLEFAMNQCVPCVQAMKAKIDSSGLKVWSVHLPFSRTLDISVLDNEQRAKNVQIIAEMIALCGSLHPSRLVLHPSSEPVHDVDREQRIANSSHSIAALKGYADKIGAQLCIENLPRTCLGNTPEELLRIMGDIPGVGICYDQNHYMRGSTEHFIRVAGHKIGTIHASDFDGAKECHWLPTQGIIPWGQCMKDLAAAGYKGVFMYEATKNKDNTALTPQQVVDSFEAIKKECGSGK
jgi:sugar phosphate isomerase/epimerase